MVTLPFLFLAAATLVNAGFEDVENGKAVGWHLPGNMRIARGAGHNGSAGLVWESAGTSVSRSVARQDVAIASGMQYKFSALVRTERFSCGKGAKMCAYVFDASGKKLVETYPKGVRNSTDWVRVGGIVDAPAGAAVLRLTLDVLPGASGKVVFDDVLMEQQKLNAATHAFSSSYRDEGCEAEVTFSGFVNVPPGGAEGDLSAFFVYRDATGKVCRSRAAIANRKGDLYASAGVRAESLAAGTQQIRLEVEDKSGNSLGSTSFSFVRAPEPSMRRVSIDRHGRCIVNGKPFFPIGMYSHRMSEEDAAVYATGPFNSVVVYGLSERADLDLLAKHGIMYVPTLKNEIPGRLFALKRGIKTQAESDTFFRAEIAKLKDAPNLLAWYVCDEAPLTELDARKHLYALYRACDGDHPCWAVMDKQHRIRDWVAICDVMGADPYPVAGRPMSRVSAFCASLRAATCGVRPFWNVPQNFDWQWYGRKETNGTPNRMPTTEEMAFMNWCHIAAGANGLFGYTYSAIRQEESKGRGKRVDFPEHWKSICNAYADVKRLAPVLLSVEETPPVPDVPDETPVRMWRKDGALYVLACNAGNSLATVEVRVRTDGAVQIDGMELGDSEFVSANGGTLVFKLPPNAYSMIRCAR